MASFEPPPSPLARAIRLRRALPELPIRGAFRNEARDIVELEGSSGCPLVAVGDGMSRGRGGRAE